MSGRTPPAGGASAIPFPLDAVRACFPALSVSVGDRSRAYLDAPGGTQVCADAIDAMARHLRGGTANDGGAFTTSRAVATLGDATRRAIADLLHADPAEIAFGPNMTTLTFAAAQALGRGWQAGDELVVTRLDHDANVAPWLEIARDRGMTVRWLDFNPADGTLRLDQLASLLSARTRLVAVGGASNALGTVNDLATIVATVRASGDALVYVDAVQLAPHALLDVAALGCDLLAFSAYKMFGPHMGVLWGRRALADDLPTSRVRPASALGMRRFETGTPSFESQAGLLATIDYFEWLGGIVAPHADSRRARLAAAFYASEAHERALGERLLGGLRGLDGVRLYGPPTMAGRVPTFAFTVAGGTVRRT